MGRTTIELDDKLVRQAQRLTGARSKRETVDIALRQLVRRDVLYRAIPSLKGQLAWEGSINAWRASR